MTYQVQEQLKPSGLQGISDDQINDHWNLYKGYVTQSNKLIEDLNAMLKEGKGDTPGYADRRRRYGFEYNGMILHEYYFGNLKAGANDLGSGILYDAIIKTWGSTDAWKADYVNTGKTRGIGWAILYADPATGALSNHFIQLHEDGNIAGAIPILVMDVFEHAYMVDHKAGGRPDYISAFMSNINWDVVKNRYDDVKSGKIGRRF